MVRKASEKIKTLEEIKLELNKARTQGKKIVTTNGCFDILHVGHVRYLQEAKEFGDILVVAVNSDDSVKAIKGDKKPLVPEDERAELLAALECVDYVMIFPELNPIKFLEELRPDVHVKGGDYTLEKVIERKTVESFGGEMRVVSGVSGKSTTNIINLILERYGDNEQ
ncbi:D-glycero-beta-D-manno-heptose 1-phosphate adenylyltransferase [Candidatus Poribacteria bacterium]|nr:D-glycero-beta-D-manno-heptose 1-phosphate adenylyltransferase [Candidatus Poribacteria bacterium]